jgi:ABC-type nitrate/sulfonate/bicarbonate transport system substrate-binding protein
MKNKFSINRLALAFASVLLCTVFSSCGTTHIEFTIQWVEVWKTIGLIVLGAIIVIVILAYLFRNFRVW